MRVRQRVRNTYIGSRIRRGSGMFSSGTWKAAVLAGAIYGGARYLSSPYYRRYPNRSKCSTLSGIVVLLGVIMSVIFFLYPDCHVSLVLSMWA